MEKTLYHLSIRSMMGFLLISTMVFAEEPSTVAKSIPVTTATAGTGNLEIWETSHGKLLSKTAPMIAAEVGGRVISVKVEVGHKVKIGQELAKIDDADFLLGRKLADADSLRLRALIEAQQLQVTRLQKLVRQKSVNQSSLDDARAQLGSLQAQLAAAKVRRQQADRNILKTRIVSPVDGRIIERKISVGDYLKKGTPVFKITTLKALQAQLPYPESLASRLRVGQPARLSSAIRPGRIVESQVTEISPGISPSNLAINVLVDLSNPGGWEPGASVTGNIKVGEHKNAVIVPEGCVVRRPSGLVVYKIDQGKAIEVAVTTGLTDHGQIEILSGVQAGDELALDGAAYLTGGVNVEIKSTKKIPGDAQ